MEKLLSVIVPIYNVEKYLPQCIESIINQTYKNLEIILVNDGSLDKCGEICDDYAEKDFRIRVIHKKNGGISSARNVGIDICNGEYIGFVDSDDYIELNMYEVLYKALLEHNLDLIDCNVYRDKLNKVKGDKNNGTVEVFDGYTALLNSLRFNDFTAAWNKLYTRAAIGDIRFPEGRKYEDSAVSYLILANTKRVGHINSTLYHYRVNPNSITQTSFDAQSRWDFVLGYIARYDYAQMHNLPCIDECNSLMICSALSCLTAYYANPQPRYKKYYDLAHDLICRHKIQSSYIMLSIKYKIFLFCFDKMDFIHKMSSKVSYLYKVVRNFAR